MPKRSPEYLSARRDEVLEGARRCFARWGFEGATVPRLEREIGSSHGAIFNYFENKLELFLEVARRDHGRWDAIWRESGFEALAEAIVHEDPHWLGVHLEFERRVRREPELLARVRSELGGREEELEWFERERAAGRIRDDVPAETIFAFLHLVLDGLALARTAPGREIDLQPILGLVRDALAPRTAGAQPRSG